MNQMSLFLLAYLYMQLFLHNNELLNNHYGKTIVSLI